VSDVSRDSDLVLERAKLDTEKESLRADRAEAELDRVLAEMASQNRYYRFQLWRRTVDAGRWVGIVAASWIPIRGLTPIVQALAGRDTRFDGTLQISVFCSVAISLCWAATARQSNVRKRKIEKQRTRLTALEEELDRMQEASLKRPQIPTQPNSDTGDPHG
jgi:hypothetical protein